MLEVLASLEVPLRVMRTFLGDFPDFSDPAGQTGLSSLLPQCIHRVLHNVLDLMILAMGVEIDIEEAVKLEVEGVVREMVLSTS
jgi:hypothetical protein